MLVDRTGRVWAMQPDEMMIVESMAAREAQAAGAAPQAMLAGARRLDGSAFATVVDGVAVVPARGLLMRQASAFFCSYEEIERDLGLAVAHPEVRAIVLDIDSPGGLAAGVGDLAATLRRVGREKPVSAFVGGLAASAAYWIAAAAGQVTLGSGAVVGSVGAIIEYVDIEPILVRMGARIVRVVAEQSPNKRLDRDSEAGRAELQALVDAVCTEFIDGVALGRGRPAAEILERFGGGVVFAADEALARGMADRRGTLAALIAELAGHPDTGLRNCVASTSVAEYTKPAMLFSAGVHDGGGRSVTVEEMTARLDGMQARIVELTKTADAAKAAQKATEEALATLVNSAEDAGVDVKDGRIVKRAEPEYVEIDGERVVKSAVPAPVLRAIEKQAEEIARMKAQAEEVALAKRGDTELPHLAGTGLAKGRLLAAIGADTAMLQSLKAADAAMAKAYDEVGTASPEEGSPAYQLDALAKAHAHAQGMTYEAAYAAVTRAGQGASLLAEIRNAAGREG